MAIVTVNLDTREYHIIIKTGLLSRAGEEISRAVRGRRAMVVTEPTVAPLYLERVLISLRDAGFDVHSAEIPGGEQNKTLETVSNLYEGMLDAKLDRSSVLITLGGGVTGDLAGFAAATYLRGIDFVQIPTTLLAQVDASIGGKVGVDLPRGKNLVGAFHQPKCVLIDPEVLTTLPRREFAGGLAEMIKHGIIAGQPLFDFMRDQSDALQRLDADVLETAIARSCEVKAGIVVQDEKESGIRAFLNYGHTVGHGIEAATGFSKYNHGEAVSIGMVTAAIIAEQIGLAEDRVAKSIAELLSSVGLPVAPNKEIDIDLVIKAMAYDKKVLAGKIRFVLPKRIGDVVITDAVTEADVRTAIEEQARIFG